MWLVQYFRRESASDALHSLNSPALAWSDKSSQNRLHTFDEAVHYLFRTYSTDENISLAIAGLNRFLQENMTERNYSNAVRDRSIACGNAYGNDYLLVMQVADLHESIQGSVRQLCIDHPTANLDQLASYARSSANIQRRLIAKLDKLTVLPDGRHNTRDKTDYTANDLYHPRSSPRNSIDSCSRASNGTAGSS